MAPPTDEKRRQVNVYLRPDEIAELDQIAEASGESRGVVVRQLLKAGLVASAGGPEPAA